jgi:hypothetical protein
VLARGLEQLGPAVLALLQTPCLDLETSRFVGEGTISSIDVSRSKNSSSVICPA